MPVMNPRGSGRLARALSGCSLARVLDWQNLGIEIFGKVHVVTKVPVALTGEFLENRSSGVKVAQ